MSGHHKMKTPWEQYLETLNSPTMASPGSLWRERGGSNGGRGRGRWRGIVPPWQSSWRSWQSVWMSLQSRFVNSHGKLLFFGNRRVDASVPQFFFHSIILRNWALSRVLVAIVYVELEYDYSWTSTSFFQWLVQSWNEDAHTPRHFVWSKQIWL
jgi:hypothetical protein